MKKQYHFLSEMFFTCYILIYIVASSCSYFCLFIIFTFTRADRSVFKWLTGYALILDFLHDKKIIDFTKGIL